MKKVIITILIVCIFSNVLLTDYSVQNIYGSTKEKKFTTGKKNIKVKVKLATKKQLKLKVTNITKRKFFYGGSVCIKKTCKKQVEKG